MQVLEQIRDEAGRDDAHVGLPQVVSALDFEGSHGMLHAYLDGSAPALEEQSLAQLASSYQATEWLRGWVGDAPDPRPLAAVLLLTGGALAWTVGRGSERRIVTVPQEELTVDLI